MSRRKFLERGLKMAVAAYTAKHGLALDIAKASESAALNPDRIKYVAEFSRDAHDIGVALRDTPNVRDVLEKGDPVSAMRIAVEHILEPDWKKLKGSEFDPEVLDKHVVLIGHETSFPSRLRMTALDKGDLEDVMTLADADSAKINFGQAVPISQSEAIVPAHVLHSLGKTDVKGVTDPVADAAKAFIPGARFRQDQFATFTVQSNSDVHGRFVVIDGIRPDEKLGRTGRKRYGGIALSLAAAAPLRHFLEARFPGMENIVKNSLPKGILVLSTSKEAKWAHSSAMNMENRPAAGMSGGISAMHDSHHYQPFGIQTAAFYFELDGKSYTAYLLVGPDVIQSVLKMPLSSSNGSWDKISETFEEARRRVKKP